MELVSTEKINKTINGCIRVLNKDDYTEQEIVVIMSQLLIKVGMALFDPEGKKLEKGIDWHALNREYYSSKEANVGLGFLLNGGSMMSVLGEEVMNQLKQVDGEKQDGNNLPNSDQVS